MDKRTENTYQLLASTTFLWIWQSVQATFDNALPFLDISEDGFQLKAAGSLRQNEILDSASIIIPVSEIIAMCVGVGTMASLYSLYWVCSEGRARFWQNLAFILLATVSSLGYGIHGMCVIAQQHISQDNSLYALLDFMHERCSHNMFQFGMFSLFLLVVWAQKPRSVKTTIVRYKSIASAVTTMPCSCRGALCSVGAVAVGLFMSVFSNITETGNIALAFYLSIFVSVYLFMKLRNYDFDRMLVMLGQYPLLEYHLTVSMYGLPALFIHYWFFM